MPWQITLVDLSTRMAITLPAALEGPTLWSFFCTASSRRMVGVAKNRPALAKRRSIGRLGLFPAAKLGGLLHRVGDLLGRVAEVVGRRNLQPALGQDLLAEVDVGALEPDDEGYA